MFENAKHYNEIGSQVHQVLYEGDSCRIVFPKLTFQTNLLLYNVRMPSFWIKF